MRFILKAVPERRAIPPKYFENILWIQLELLKIHIKSVKISRFSPKYWAIFSFLSQVCCLVTPTESFVLKIFSKYFGGIGLLVTTDFSAWKLASTYFSFTHNYIPMYHNHSSLHLNWVSSWCAHENKNKKKLKQLRVKICVSSLENCDCCIY